MREDGDHTPISPFEGAKTMDDLTNGRTICHIEPLTNDPVNYVRQGALIASALVLIQQSEATSPKVKEIR